MSMVDLTAFAPRIEDILLSSRLSAVPKVSRIHPSRFGVLTYSTTIGSAGDIVVFELEVHVEDVRIQLDLAIEAVADPHPVRCWLRHPVDPALSSRIAHRGDMCSGGNVEGVAE